ncbi:sodium:solute symporter family protein [Maribellus maritimus]|uniref:sodium:solute symporter family protein n=1 Tax=Maribellus maritimus TaxID=2870838 RepID=UPI001EEB7CCD|nr:sodium:solute symporter family protein [Maribellus maritimus]MCG6190593.1 sodium:solute symporter family protein [Maribellus maritimus]
MQIQIIIAVYFLALIVIGVFSFFKIKTPGDYYVAGKKAGFIPVSGSLLATLLGGSAILGTIELGQQIGWAALWLLFSAASGLLFLVPLSKYVKRFGNYTLPELLGKFYGKRAEIIASAVIPVAWLGIVAAQIIAAAKILNGLHIVSYYPAAIVSGVVFIVYTLIGGQHSIIKTDTIQSVLIIAGIIFITFYAVKHPTSGEVEHFSPALLFNNNFKPFDLLILLLTYSVTFVVGPDIYSRLFCAKDEKTASKSVLTVALILIPLSFALTYLGIYSNTVESAGIIDFAEHLLPGWMYGLFLAALLSAVMSSADTTLLTSSIILGELATGDLSGKSSIKLTRLLVIILGVTSIFIALFVNSVIQSLLFALTLFSGAFTVPTLFGLLRIKVDNKQIIPAIVAGGTIALTGKIVNTYFNDLTGNIIIIFSFLISTIILFSTTIKKQRK